MSDYSSTILSDNPQVYYRLNEASGSIATNQSNAGTSFNRFMLRTVGGPLVVGVPVSYNATVAGATYSQRGAIANDADKSMLFAASGGITLPSGLSSAGWTAISLEFWYSAEGSTWHHCVTTADHNGVTYYLDGTVVSSPGGPFPASSLPTTVYVPKSFGGTLIYTPALTNVSLICTTSSYLDEVAIYNITLTAAQVAAHYAIGLAQTTGTSTPPPPRPFTPGQAYTVYINDIPVFVEAGSITVDKTIGKRSTARFVAHTDTSTHFEQYEEVTIYDANNILVFSGFITQPKAQKPGWQNSLRHTITCVDQHYLTDKRVIGRAYTHKTCGAIVADIVKNYLAAEGVSVGQIYDGLAPSDTLYPSPVLYPNGNVGAIPNATFVYCTIAQALDSLVKQASASGVPYYWQIDENGKLWFVPYTAIVNTTIVDGTLVDDGTRSGVIPTVTRQNPTYRNTQYLLGGVAQTLLQTETRIGDGHAQAWIMGYEIATQPTITVDGVAKTVGVKGSTGFDFYWGPKDAIITQDSKGTVLTGANVLQIVYTGQYPAVFYAQDASQVAYQASIDSTTGIVEVVDTDTTVVTSDAGFGEASQLLTRWGKQGSQFTFATLQSGYAQGQLVTANYSPFNLSNAQMLIEQVSVSDARDGINLWYTITGVVGPYDITWVDLFSKLFQHNISASAINIGISQTLTLFKTFNITLNPTVTLTGTVFSVPVPSTTLYPGTSLFPG